VDNPEKKEGLIEDNHTRKQIQRIRDGWNLKQFWVQKNWVVQVDAMIAKGGQIDHGQLNHHIMEENR